MNPDSHPIAVITGGSAGLGLSIAQTLVRAGYDVFLVGRNNERLEAAAEELRTNVSGNESVTVLASDVTQDHQVQEVFRKIHSHAGRLDVLVNCVGVSDRGLVENLSADRLQELITLNVTTSLLCSQAAIPMLEETSGVIVNIGSLAGKVGARYIGGYSAAKHALAGLTQQLRLELRPRGIHVAMVSPGPIRRDDDGTRYESQVDATLPSQASAPGAGTRIKGLDPEVVAAAVLRCIQRRSPDIVLPGHLRVLIAIGHLFPRLGDWLLVRFTSTPPDGCRQADET